MRRENVKDTHIHTHATSIHNLSSASMYCAVVIVVIVVVVVGSN